MPIWSSRNPSRRSWATASSACPGRSKTPTTVVGSVRAISLLLRALRPATGWGRRGRARAPPRRARPPPRRGRRRGRGSARRGCGRGCASRPGARTPRPPRRPRRRGATLRNGRAVQPAADVGRVRRGDPPADDDPVVGGDPADDEPVVGGDPAAADPAADRAGPVGRDRHPEQVVVARRRVPRHTRLASIRRAGRYVDACAVGRPRGCCGGGDFDPDVPGPEPAIVSARIEHVLLLRALLRASVLRPRRPRRGEPPPTPAARRSHAAHAHAPAPARPRQAVLAAGALGPARLAPPPGPGHARDGRAVAPPRLEPVPAVAVWGPTRPPAPERRDAR